MSRVALNVEIECIPGSRDDVLRALAAHRARCLEEEPGTLQFEVMVPSDDPGRIYLFELYRDDEALQAHVGGASLARYRAEISCWVKDTRIRRCSLHCGTA